MADKTSDINKLLDMQRQLMEKVPHTVRPDSLVKMSAGIKIIDTLLRYLNSTGHKPWRPIPLSPLVQQVLIQELEDKVETLSYIHHTVAGADKDFSNCAHYSRQLVSAYGIIEEAIEHLDSLAKGTRAEQLEELTDQLFFFLEQIILGGFTWTEIEEEYVRKHAINMERYRKAKEGNFSWDLRGKKEGL